METPITATVLIKNLLYIPAALFLAGLDTQSYIILTCFMATDLVLGVIRAVSLGGGVAFKSYKLGAGVLSKCLVTAVPLIVVWAGKGANVDLTLLGQWSVGSLILAQAYSMLGHINAIRLGQDTKEWDAVSAILRVLQSTFENILKDAHSKEK